MSYCDSVVITTVCFRDCGDRAPLWKYWPVFSPPQCPPIYRGLWRTWILWCGMTVEDLLWWRNGEGFAGNEGEDWRDGEEECGA